MVALSCHHDMMQTFVSLLHFTGQIFNPPVRSHSGRGKLSKFGGKRWILVDIGKHTVGFGR
jgi:hypothetical protein